MNIKSFILAGCLLPTSFALAAGFEPPKTETPVPEPTPIAIVTTTPTNLSPNAKGSVNLRVNAGIQPTFFSSHGFHKSFNHPNLIGLQIGGLIDDNVELFGEVSHNSAKSKRVHANSKYLDLNGLPIYSNGIIKTSSYKATNVYLGSRYYAPLDSNFIPYFGIKLGMVHRDPVKLSSIVPEIKDVTPLADKKIFKKDNQFSAGLLTGFDIHFSPNVSLGAGLDVIATPTRKVNKEYKGVVHKGAVISTPIYASLKITFPAL